MKDRFFEVDRVEHGYLRTKNGGGAEKIEKNTMLALVVAGKRIVEATTGKGSVNALFTLYEKILIEYFPDVFYFRLVDYETKILNIADAGSGAIVRITVEIKYNGDSIRAFADSDDKDVASDWAMEKCYRMCLQKIHDKKAKAA